MEPFRGRYLRLIALWAMILPFAAASLIAKGVMPAVSPAGVIMLVICTGDGMVEMAVDAVTMEPLADPGKDGPPAPDAGSCAWAAAHAAFVIADLFARDAGQPGHRRGAGLWKFRDAGGGGDGTAACDGAAAPALKRFD